MKRAVISLALLAAFTLQTGCQRAPLAQARVIEVWEHGDPVPEPLGLHEAVDVLELPPGGGLR